MAFLTANLVPSEFKLKNYKFLLGPTEQLIVTSIKHEDGSPPTTIIKKEPANPSSSGASGSGSSSTSTVNSNDSNNNNDTNDNKNNSNLSGNPDEKDSANDNSITDECELRLSIN